MKKWEYNILFTWEHPKDVYEQNKETLLSDHGPKR